jgi:asparagine synthetase B (glutamine-hydrolysing)
MNNAFCSYSVFLNKPIFFGAYFKSRSIIGDKFVSDFADIYKLDTYKDNWLHISSSYKLKFVENCIQILFNYHDYSTDLFYDLSENVLRFKNDIVGSKKLFIYRSKNIIYFSNSIQIFTIFFKNSLSPNRGYLTEYLCDRIVSGKETFYNEILMLPCNSKCYIKRGGDLSFDSIYHFNKDTNYQSNSLLTNTIELSSIVKDSLSRIFDSYSENDLGIALSGGIDSTILYSFITKYFSNKVTAYHHYFKNNEYREYNEKPLVEDTIIKLGGKCKYISIDDLLPSINIDIYKHVIHYGPPINPNIKAFNCLLREMIKDGNKLAFYGHGGDFFQGSSVMYIDLFRYKKFITLFFSMAHEISALPNFISYLSMYFFGSLFFNNVNKNIVPLWIKNSKWAQNRIAVNSVFHNTAYEANNVDLTNCLNPNLQWNMYQDIETSNQAGLLIYYPFYYDSIIQFLFSIPPHQKYYRGYTKFILRNSFKYDVKLKVLKNKNKVFITKYISDGLRKYMKRRGKLSLHNYRLLDLNIIDKKKTEVMLRNFINGNDDLLKETWLIEGSEFWLNNMFN